MDMDGIPIYEIYALCEPIKMDNLGIPRYGGRESMGFYYELETAVQAVENNWADINECGSYNAVIIVKKTPGLYPIALIQGYYIFNEETDKYDKAELPEGMGRWNLG